MRLIATAYRGHDPKWAFDPLSGAGAATHGGRFNPPGVPALYLALTPEGVFLEQGHGFARRFEPLTVCTYSLDVDDIADLTTEPARTAAGVSFGDLASAWFQDAAAGREPASWRIARRLIAQDAAGILVPSFAVGARPDMRNIVLWTWSSKPPHQVLLHDPNRRLPRDQPSWRE